MPNILYKSGYKYKLEKQYKVKIDLIPPTPVDIDWVKLDVEGNLSIVKNYCWDGPSGPTIDTKTFMRGSLVHDALYQLMREGYLDHNVYREKADQILRSICIEDGMSSIRAWWVYTAVRAGGLEASIKENPPVSAPGE